MLYLVEIANTTSGMAKAITAQEDINTARMVYHQTMSSAMANPAVNAITVVVLTDAGNTVIQDYWVRQVEVEIE